MLPICNCQRQLIIGYRQTGKTSIAVDTIINQRNNELQMACVYVGIGQKKSAVSLLVSKLKQYESLHYTVCVLAGASYVAALQLANDCIKNHKGFSIYVYRGDLRMKFGDEIGAFEDYQSAMRILNSLKQKRKLLYYNKKFEYYFRPRAELFLKLVEI